MNSRLVQPVLAMFLLVALSASCASSPRPYPHPEDPILMLEHDPGMGVTNGFWYKLFHPRSKSSEWWSVRIYDDGIVEQRAGTCAGEVWRDRKVLTPMDLEELQRLARAVRVNSASFVCCSDIPTNRVVIWEGGSELDIQQHLVSWDGAPTLDPFFEEIFSFVTERYGSPRLPICLW